jgi:cytochrome c biogenesis protein
MRFAIAMLLVIAISSIIGTILKQAEPYTNYVNRFGDFWSKAFIYLDLHQIYSAWWFLLILAFLVISTCLCIMRTWPKFYKQIKNYQLNARKEFLQNQTLNTSFELDENKKSHSAEDYTNYLKKQGFKFKIKTYEDINNYLIAGKSGKANKWGYLFAHIGIVVVCVGGLIDGNLPLKILQMQGKIKPFNGENIIPQNAILSSDNASFRANLFVPEGESANLAIINTTDGILGQKLPFNVELKRFWVDYYETGMPKRFVSDIKINDSINNKVVDATLEVNKPFNYNGYNLFQASFEDGGSSLELKANNLVSDLNSQNILKENLKIIVGQSQKVKLNNQEYTLDITDFRAINVHNLQENNSDNKDTKEQNKIKNLHGSSAQIKDKKFKNIGPSIEYTLRDSAGQAVAYHSYMLPIMVNDKPTYLIGMRTDNMTPFKYLHIPAGVSSSNIDDWLSLYQALHNQDMRSQAALKYSKQYSEKLQSSLFESSYKALNIFAQGGLSALSEFIQKTVPAKEQAKASEVILRMLQGSLWELWDMSQQKISHKQLAKSVENQDYLQRALIAISDASLLKTNTWFSLASFNEKKASVIQVTKSPGQNIVYLGCLLLVVGVFLMIFIQEKRLWLLKQNNTIILAMQFQRENMHSKNQFTEISDEIKKL